MDKTFEDRDVSSVSSLATVTRPDWFSMRRGKVGKVWHMSWRWGIICTGCLTLAIIIMQIQEAEEASFLMLRYSVLVGVSIWINETSFQ